jgi:hypothetical protein
VYLYVQSILIVEVPNPDSDLVQKAIFISVSRTILLSRAWKTEDFECLGILVLRKVEIVAVELFGPEDRDVRAWCIMKKGARQTTRLLFSIHI